jgi:hypothetical protein
MTAPTFNLLVEEANCDEFQYVIEEESSDKKKSMHIIGPYMVCNEVNRNNRCYPLEEMKREVDRYVDECVKKKRSFGELNHPTTADVALDKACHLVTDLKFEGNVVMGKSKILSTPAGLIVQSLINDGCSLGVSSRSLGQLVEDKDGSNTVKDMRLIAVDCVADPSYPKAFVNGILESKQYVCNTDGSFCELYDSFEKDISTLPKNDVEHYLKEQVLKFLTGVKNKY